MRNPIPCLKLSNAEHGFTHIKICGGRDDFMTIATTRPETLFGDVAIAVNPEVCSVAVNPDSISMLYSKYKHIINQFMWFLQPMLQLH